MTTVVAGIANLSRHTLYDINYGRAVIGKHVQAMLSEAFGRLERNEYQVHRQTPWSNPRDGIEQPINVWVIHEKPANAKPYQSRIVREREFDRWARCSACGGAQFSKFGRSRNWYYGCDGCVDTPDRLMFGAKFYPSGRKWGWRSGRRPVRRRRRTVG
jgi:hypothetical protein